MSTMTNNNKGEVYGVHKINYNCLFLACPHCESTVSMELRRLTLAVERLTQNRQQSTMSTNLATISVLYFSIYE